MKEMLCYSMISFFISIVRKGQMDRKVKIHVITLERVVLKITSDNICRHQKKNVACIYFKPFNEITHGGFIN